MNIPADIANPEGAPAPASPGPIGTSREERNRQRRAWRNSPANPRNKSRGGPRAARSGYRA